MSEERTPGGIVIPDREELQRLNLPTPEDTKNAIEAIDPARNEMAALALKELAIAVIDAVNKVDQRYGVHNFLVNLEIKCEGPGSFRLNITDKNSECDPQAVAQEVADQLDREAVGDYHKQARAIQMEFTNARAEGPDGVPPDEVPGAQAED